MRLLVPRYLEILDRRHGKGCAEFLRRHAAADHGPDGIHVEDLHALLEKWAAAAPGDRAVKPRKRVVTPLPRKQWPWKVVILSRFREEGDRGVGDVLERVIAAGGGEKFLRTFPQMANRLGELATVWLAGVKTAGDANPEGEGTCSPCAARRDLLNARYPFTEGS